MFGPVGAAGWRTDRLLDASRWRPDVPIVSSTCDCASGCIWWRVESSVCSGCDGLGGSFSVDVFVGNIFIGDVAILLSADDWRLLVLETDSSRPTSSFCWRRSGG